MKRCVFFSLLCSFLGLVQSAKADPIEVSSRTPDLDVRICAQSTGTSEAFRFRYSWSTSIDRLSLNADELTLLGQAIDQVDGYIGDDPVPTPSGPDDPTIPQLAKRQIASLLRPLDVRVVLRRGGRTMAICEPPTRKIETGVVTYTSDSGTETIYSINLPVGAPAVKTSHRCKSPSGRILTPSPRVGDTLALVQKSNKNILKGTFKSCPKAGCRSAFFCS